MRPSIHASLIPPLPADGQSTAERADIDEVLHWMTALGCVTEDGHPQRVMSLTLSLAEALSLMDQTYTRRTVIRAGLLHDVGKTLVPADILNKRGLLTVAERQVIQQHAPLGARLAAEYPGIEAEVLDAVRYHHEQFNGQGYPSGLIGLEIPQLARILSVADVYDALTSDRPYRVAWTNQEAIAYLQQQAGEMFDPQVVSTLTELIG